jgi:hypothetical protein
MTDAPAMEQTARRVDRLLRSLVGVVDLRPSWDRSGRLVQVHVLKSPDIQDHQLVRNVVSALNAGFGLRLETSGLCIYADAALFGASTEHLPAVQPAVVESVAAAAHAAVGEAGVPSPDEASVQPGSGVADPAGDRPGHAVNGAANGAGNGTGNGAGNGVANGAGNGAAAEGRYAPAPSNGGYTSARSNGNGGVQHAAHGAASGAERYVGGEPAVLGTQAGGVAIERTDVERQGGTLRCHVVLALGGRRYSAIAEVPDAPTVEAELAARVTLDALRAGALTDARLEGIGFTTINDVTYLVAAIRESNGGGRRASAALMVGSMARTAATAALGAVGPITQARQHAAERMLGGH